ncbi:MAG TPA: DUF4013 domain-containing protein [Methanothermobacter sp.]|nr:conserved hypothetical protein [Methanothermobacter sp. MT-2]HHW04621.1 DUF4013 domain-containing protein [Methanothermobacter sp.]HOK72085.1 DUF4013 domain-containing protein [Methanothermobacter sp.]HOL68398.1 DUF4013 domain-containing protein [Methanothermobacter sp.]HPQ04156.1 DUF4013 domain-containing protein [Methanothermobacter sp.]
MDVHEIIVDAIKYPASSWRKFITLAMLFLLLKSLTLFRVLPKYPLISATLSLILTLIPLFLVIGYIFRNLKTTIAGSDELPEFDKLGGMFIDGLKVLLVSIIYMIIPGIIIGAIIYLNIPNSTIRIITQSIGVIVTIIFILLANIAIAHMASKKGQFKAAFHVREVTNAISKIGWGKYIIWYIIVIIIIGIIRYAVTFIIKLGYIGLSMVISPLVSYIIASILSAIFISSYISLFYSRALGLLYPK